jgi:hypothetical protein
MARDNTSATPSPTEPVIDRYRRWSPVWYPWIKRMLDTLRQTSADLDTVQEEVTTLTTTVGSNTTSITNILQSVDGIEAQWGVTINTNGQVTGLVRLDSDAIQSTFTVLADRFIVANPATPANQIQLFTTGTIDGVTNQVGVNALFIIDGTILARHIAVDSLSSITADIGTVTAGKLQSADGRMVIDLDQKSIRIET